MELPKKLARPGIHSLEPAVERSIERDIARRDHCAAPHREVLVDGPDLLALHRVPGREFAAIAAGPRIHINGRAHIWRACDKAHLARLIIHAKMLVRNVKE